MAYHLSDGNSYRANEKPIRRGVCSPRGKSTTLADDDMIRPLAQAPGSRLVSGCAGGARKLLATPLPLRPSAQDLTVTHVSRRLACRSMQARPAVTNARPAPRIVWHLRVVTHGIAGTQFVAAPRARLPLVFAITQPVENGGRLPRWPFRARPATTGPVFPLRSRIGWWGNFGNRLLSQSPAELRQGHWHHTIEPDYVISFRYGWPGGRIATLESGTK